MQSAKLDTSKLLYGHLATAEYAVELPAIRIIRLDCVIEPKPMAIPRRADMMKIPSKAASTASALIALGSLSIGLVQMSPVANASPVTIGVVQQTTFLQRGPSFLQQSPVLSQDKGPELSDDENRAILGKKAGNMNGIDRKTLKRALDKIKTQEKYNGDRNIQKRENEKKAQKGKKAEEGVKP